MSARASKKGPVFRSRTKELSRALALFTFLDNLPQHLICADERVGYALIRQRRSDAVIGCAGPQTADPVLSHSGD